VLRDVAQAGVHEPELGQGLQRRGGELVAPLGELVNLAARDPLAFPLFHFSQCSTSVNDDPASVMLATIIVGARRSQSYQP
jgi:hypothetical protein